MHEIPAELKDGPFTNRQARDAGVPAHMLTGRRFARIHPRVWHWIGHPLTERDRVEAARLALPGDARLTGITRIQEAGLDYGPRRPLRFVVARDHHIALDDIFLHRTKVMPPCDERSVTMEAAFVAYCALTRVIDAVKVGDWVLRNRLMTLTSLLEFAQACPWRDGALEATWLADHLDQESRSLPESEVRAVLAFAGLPAPVANGVTVMDDGRVVAGDLVYRDYGVFVEYEGVHHQEDRDQYAIDIARYASLRDSGVAYVQVTKEKLRRPQRVVEEVHQALRSRGYQGPSPHFTEQWQMLWSSVSRAIGPRPEWERFRTAG